MFSVRVKKELGSRLDAEFYSPDALQAINRIRSVGEVSTLGDEITEGYRVVYHGTDSVANLPDSMKLGFLSPTQISNEGEINFDSVDELPNYYKDQYPKGLAKSGELLIEVKGNVSKVAVVPSEFPQNLMISGSLYKVTLSDKVDSHYALAFLKSKHGQLLKNRLTSNTIINYIGKDDLYSIPLLLVSSYVQKYIGDKVRQAERLRTWAKSIERQLVEIEDRIPVNKPENSYVKYSRVSNDTLTENRLDARFYAKNHIDLYAQISSGFERLDAICNGFKYGASIPANYVGQGGVPFIRGNALSPNRIDKEDIVYLDGSMEDDLKNSFVGEGELLITRSGTVGIVAFVTPEYTNFSYGSFIIKCKLNNNNYLPAYVSWYLNSWVGQQQFRRLENGAIQLNVNIEELSSILVWKAPKAVQSTVAQLVEDQSNAVNMAKLLVESARSLVEFLIDGKLTEQLLIGAQNSLEAGDISLDREILARLTTKGLDSDGDPLFSDLDQLYDLLAQSQSLDE